MYSLSTKTINLIAECKAVYLEKHEKRIYNSELIGRSVTTYITLYKGKKIPINIDGTIKKEKMNKEKKKLYLFPLPPQATRGQIRYLKAILMIEQQKKINVDEVLYITLYEYLKKLKQ